MEPWEWNELLWALGFLSITYLPLQAAAIWKCRGGARVAAALPLLVLVPMWFGDSQPLDFHIGSQTATYFVCPYLPAMIYLIVVSLVGTRRANVCPRCGHPVRSKSFQMTRSTSGCEMCDNSTSQGDRS